MMEDIAYIGVDLLVVTAYGMEEWKRLLKLRPDMGYEILYGNLDDRLNNYIVGDEIKSSPKCEAMLAETVIYSNGDLGLCCLDYEHPYQLGNVYEKGIRAVLDSEKVNAYQKSILAGKQKFALCRVCRLLR